MNAIMIAAALGVILLTSGLALVNMAAGPVPARAGAVIAGGGAALLVLLALVKVIF